MTVLLNSLKVQTYSFFHCCAMWWYHTLMLFIWCKIAFCPMWSTHQQHVNSTFLFLPYFLPGVPLSISSLRKLHKTYSRNSPEVFTFLLVNSIDQLEIWLEKISSTKLGISLWTLLNVHNLVRSAAVCNHRLIPNS